jgi:hypothetical protein
MSENMEKNRTEILRNGMNEIYATMPKDRPVTDDEAREIQDKLNELLDKAYPEGRPEVDLSQFKYTPIENSEKRYMNLNNPALKLRILNAMEWDNKVRELNITEGAGESNKLSNTSNIQLPLRGKVININRKEK